MSDCSDLTGLASASLLEMLARFLRGFTFLAEPAGGELTERLTLLLVSLDSLRMRRCDNNFSI